MPVLVNKSRRAVVLSGRGVAVAPGRKISVSGITKEISGLLARGILARVVVEDKAPEPVVVPEPAPEPVVVAEPAPEPVVVAEPAPEPVVVAEPVVVPEPVPEPVVVAEPVTEPSPEPEVAEADAAPRRRGRPARSEA